MKTNIITALLAVSAVITATMATAQAPAVPRFINFQGKLTDTNGLPLNGTYEITFNIYSNSPVPAPANWVWGETHASVEVQRGLFSVLLGSFTNLDMSCFPFDVAGSTNRWLEIRVGSDLLSPTKEFVSVPYAFRASDADMVDGLHASRFVTNSLTNEIIILQNATNNLQAQIVVLQDATNALNLATNALQGQIIELTAATNNLQVEVGALQGATNDLNGQVVVLQNATNNLQVQVVGLQGATNVLNMATNALQDQIAGINTNFIRKWQDDFTMGRLSVSNSMEVRDSLSAGSNLSVRGILSVTETNIIRVMGTNIITNWPHASMVGNLNADMLDGKHANELGGITNEVDPTVISWVKDGVSWAEIRDIAGDMPDGFKDDVDDVGVTNWAQLKVYGMPAGFTDDVDNVGITNWLELTTNGMPAGFADGVDNGITNEVDPQVDDAMTLNSVPRWDGAKLVTGSIFNDPVSGNVGIGTASSGSKLTVAGGDVELLRIA